jgi:hypothetical protein
MSRSTTTQALALKSLLEAAIKVHPGLREDTLKRFVLKFRDIRENEFLDDYVKAFLSSIAAKK